MKHLRFFPALLLIIALHSPTLSYGWGATGHQLVVDAALTMLKPATKQKVMNILNGLPPDSAAVWMDKVRRHNPYTYMDNWHFVNIEKGQTYKQVASKNDVVYNLQRVRTTFEKRTKLSADSAFMNLKVLFHLMGDIAQPLHCGYGHDTGGNSIHVTTPVYNASYNNLHHVWDDVIIWEGKINLDSILNFCKRQSKDQVKKITSGTAESWMEEGRSYLDKIYDFKQNPTGKSKLTMQYLDSNVPLVQQQIGYAAIRLADVLEKSFGTGQ